MNSNILVFIKRYRWYFLVFFLSLPAIRELLLPGYFSMHDDLQILRLEQFDRCFSDGQFPCRWIPDAGFGYGYPMFNYYPPLPYFLAEILLKVGFNLFWSIKLTFALSFVLSGLFMFLLASALFGSLGGLLAAVFYIYAPYHSVDVYVRGAMNEAWGLIWFPLIFYASYKLITNKKTRNNLTHIILLALSYAALLLSHNIMTLIFTPLLGLWSLHWLVVSKNWQKIKGLLISGLWAVGIAAFFFIPVVLENNLVHIESLTIGYFNYLAHFADLKQMFLTRFWGYGGSIWGPEDGMAFPIGHLHWGFSFLIAAASTFTLIKYLTNKRKLTTKFSFLALNVWIFTVTFFYIFLIHPRSIWFWDNLPILYFAQFPWRLLAIPTFTFPLIIGSLLFFIKTNKKITKPLITVILIAFVMIWNLPFFKIDQRPTITKEEKLSGSLWELQVTGGIFDYLPSTATRPPGAPSHVVPIYIEGAGGIQDYQQGTNWFEFTAQVSSDNALVQVPIFEYPNWELTSNSQVIDHTYDDDLGRIQVNLPQGEHQITGQLKNTPIRIIANLITVFALLILVIKLVHKKSDRQ